METDKDHQKTNAIIIPIDDNIEKVENIESVESVDNNDKSNDLEEVEDDLFGQTADDERLEENHESSDNSNVTTNLFSKDHHRTTKPFGPGHEPGAGI